ncbi:MAG: IS66 family transposase [Bacilli bacterium]
MTSNYEKGLYKDFEKMQNKYDKKCDEYKFLLLRTTIAEDEELRLKKIVIKKEDKIKTMSEQNKELKKENLNLTKELERVKMLLNNDGTVAGIPTSMTPINKKKIIPNFAKNTGDTIGRKHGHKKDKLEKIEDNKITEHIEHKIETCPNCDKHKLVKTGKIISKDVKDYKILTYYTRHDFIEYKCSCCGKLVHELIPNHLKEECQYGSEIKSLALTLSNVGNVPFNKVKRIISGLSMEQITPCEGYLAKLQKVSAKKLDSFSNELRTALLSSKIVYWDDTVINVNTKQSCMRYYGNDSLCLFKAHEKKNKEGLDKDRILGLLGTNTVVEHDHNKINYNNEYCFINAECCQHLLRDLRKVELNIPERKWCKEMIKLFQSYDHKRNELLSKNIDTFTKEEVNDFIIELEHNLLTGLNEYEENSKPYYVKKELTLIQRLMEYRDNYIYWILDFDLPFTNNLSERNLRGIKSKMKISGQFQNIERAKDYASIRSYIETCRLYGKNEVDCLTRLVEDKPYTFSELLNTKK